MKVRVKFFEEVLGMNTANPNIHKEFIASKAGTKEKVNEEMEYLQTTDELIEKVITIFPKTEDGTPFMWDYQVKGMLKDAVGMLRRSPGSRSSKLTAYKKVIDGLIFAQPRKILFSGKYTMGECTRTLRAQTPQGERITLVTSETISVGAELEFEIITLDDKTLIPLVKEVLDYGKLRGMFQWRNSGKGRFTYEILDDK